MTDHPNTFHALQVRYHALDAHAKAWIIALANQAEDNKVGFSSKHTKSTRRLEILRALVALGHDGCTDDTGVRNLLHVIFGDPAHLPSVTLGHLVGSLSATEAAQFAGLATGSLAVTFSDDGVLQLVAAA